MKAFNFRFILAFLLIAYNFAFAKFAIVDIKQIEDEAVVTKNLKNQIAKAGEVLEKEVTDARAEMEKKVADLQKAASTLSSEAVEKRKGDLQKEFMAIEGSLQEHDAAIQEARTKALETINQKVKDIAKKIAEKRDYEAVFASTFIIYYPSALDITKDVINELNSEMKTVAFEVKAKKSSKKK